MSFYNETELQSAISKGLVIAVEHTVNQFLKYNKEFIEGYVYGVYSPSWYSRTRDFFNAWKTEVSGGGSSVKGEMAYDSGRIGVGAQDEGQHVSVVTGQSQAENMPELLYQSGMGCIYRPTGRDAWKKLDIYLSNSTVRSIFEAGLSKSGMPWKRKSGAITVTKTK